jgi:hypothetical protein
MFSWGWRNVGPEFAGSRRSGRAAMMIWINGAFGAGKTTLAEELHRRLPDALAFDLCGQSRRSPRRPSCGSMVG